MLPFNFHHLYYFYTIAKKGGVGTAAKELHVSQPALSAQLKQLENHLGVPLFTREGKNLLLTEEGQSALRYAETIFNVGQELRDGIRDRSRRGSLRIQIGISKFTAKACSSELLSFLYDAERSLYLCAREDHLEDLIDELKNHSLDLIYSNVPYRGRAEEKIQNHLVGKIPVVFCGHRTLARRIKKIPQDLSLVPIAIPARTSPIFDAVHEYFVKAEITPKIIGEFEDPELLLKVVQKGEAAAPLNRFSVSKGNGSQVTMIPEDTDIFDSVYLISKTRKKPHPLVTTAVSHFKINYLHQRRRS